MGWPDWTIKLVFAFIVLGFPVTVALSWAFDIDGTGIRRSHPMHLAQSGRTYASWIIDGAVALILLLTIVMLLLREQVG